jgi:hypothetical protein
MDAEPEPHVPETDTQQEQLLARLQPETDIEERLVRQLALCSTKLEHIEALLGRAVKQLRNALTDTKDELSL